MKKPTLLIAEDKTDDQKIISEAIAETGWEVDYEFIPDGETLLEIIRKKCARQARGCEPSMIVLDLRMPKLDGYHVLQYLKSSPKLRSIPIIVLSNYHDAKSINTCYSLGANSFIAKPSDFEEWVEVFRQIKGYWFDAAERPEK